MFTEAQKHMMVRLTHDLLRSPQGREWARPLLKEVNDPKGNYAGVKKDLLDILNGVLDDLYTAQKPVQSR